MGLETFRFLELPNEQLSYHVLKRYWLLVVSYADYDSCPSSSKCVFSSTFAMNGINWY